MIFRTVKKQNKNQNTIKLSIVTMSDNSLITSDDVIHSGWLTKSPPMKKIKNATSWTTRFLLFCSVSF